MDYKKETKNLLIQLKNTGIGRRQIEADLDYAEFTIDQILSKGGNETFFNRIKAYSDEKLGKSSTYTEQRRNLKNNSTKSNDVPMYSGYTTLGNIEVIDDENVKHRVMAHLPAEVFPGCDYAEKAQGDSMHPVIQNQAITAMVDKVYDIRSKKRLQEAVKELRNKFA